MPKIPEFVDGEFSDNILHALSLCSAAEIALLIKTGMLTIRPNQYGPKHNSLHYRALDDYVEVTGFSLRYFLYGNDEQPVTYYTDFDAPVIQALDSLTPVKLQILSEAIDLLYHSPLMDIPAVSPSQRIYDLMHCRRSPGYPSSVPPEDLHKYKHDVMVEMNRYGKHKVPTTLFNSEYLLDIATLLHVSVHWFLGVKRSPLYCSTWLADDIFDRYTLMQPIDQFAFIGLLDKLSDEEIPELHHAFYNGKEL